MRKYIAFYPTDHLRKTQHPDTLQHGALFLLLQHCWSYGSIPLEPAARAAIARMTLSAWRKVAPLLRLRGPQQARQRGDREGERY